MSSDCFYISTIGQLESVHFPLGVGSKSVHCRYEVVHGPDWELVSGQRSGITQCASVGNQDFHTITFNMPLEFTFRATNPFGCKLVRLFFVCWLNGIFFVCPSGPQLVFNVYGGNFWGTEVSRGNTRIHIPLAGHDQNERLFCPLVTPKPLDLCSKIAAWFSDWNPEFKDMTVLSQGHKTKGISTESYGHLVLSLSTISRGQRALGLQWKC